MCNVMQRSSASCLSYNVVGPEIELESLEDLTYVALKQAPSEDEEMESKVDAHIWLEDVEHPTSSRRPRSCPR